MFSKYFLVLFIFLLLPVFTQAGELIAGFKKADLEKVLSITGIVYDGTIGDLVKVTQKAWLRPRGKERWELDPMHEDKREQLLPLFKKMYLVDEWINQKFTYDYILFQGAWVGYGFEERMETLKKLLAVPVHAQEIAILTGSRLLTSREKKLLSQQGWKDLPEMELGLYPRLFKQQGLPIEDMILVDAPPTKQKDGSWYQSATEDAVKKWLTQRPVPQPGLVLSISHQPFCNFQHQLIESLLPKGFTIRTVGKAAAADTPVVVYLDTIARTLYVWYHGQQKNITQAR